MGFYFLLCRASQPSSCKNLLSAIQNPAAVADKLWKGLRLGRIAGPFLERLFLHYAGEFRPIQHLSFPHGDSINSCIPNDASTVKYASIDDAVRLIRRTGRGCALAKTDVKNAFRLIPINPCDYDLLGFCWEDSFNFDKCLPMGTSSSCKIWESFSTALEWIAKSKGSTIRKLIGGRGIFEPREYFFVIKFLVWMYAPILNL